MEEDLSRKKAILISGGAVGIPEGYRVPVRISRSTAGPGAGSMALAFSFGNMRVKKTIVRGKGDFDFDPENSLLLRGGEVFLRNVAIVPVAFHCPEQAFFNLDQRCMFHCVYCASPLLDKGIVKGLDGKKIVSMIRSSDQSVNAISLTSGVHGSVAETVDRMIVCVRTLRDEFPNIPIGVEPYVDDAAQIDGLKEAGATEIKINVEAATDDLFMIACPDLDRKNIFKMLEHAVYVFGKGNVASNLIVGLGESDGDVLRMIERLCRMGVVPGLRGLRIGNDVLENVKRTVGVTSTPPPERMLELARCQKKMMSRYGLDTRAFRTMCFACTCCDLTPFIDL